MAEVPKSVLSLVVRFDRHREDYRSGRYKETQVRREFIDPMFVALGWDIDNRSGYAEAYKDVIHEDAIKVGGVTKAPDYCFRIGGVRKFFLEAKKPSVDVAGQPGPAYQLRRYAWSAKLPLSILTDFEELAVYDCRIRPKPADKASAARTMYITCAEYPDRWDEIASVFSKEAVLQGSFDKYAVGRKKRGTAEVDAEFLREIEKWRDALARNIALRNRLTGRELNFAVQRIIDRIIFLRICEDRGVETYGSLQELLNGGRIYARLMEKFRAADDRYNSGLFHFNAERDRPAEPDNLTPTLNIDDKALKDIFRSLYYPQSPYEFSVLPADILGNVYEQFLGKVIGLTAGGRAKVEEKPEVKKAGGVYYTPKYIVDYIVEHTLGNILTAEHAENAESSKKSKEERLTAENAESSKKDKKDSSAVSSKISAPSAFSAVNSVSSNSFNTSAVSAISAVKIFLLSPRQVSKLRILDPACGSGSFLVGAYRKLLDYHRDWYLNDGPQKHRKKIYQGAASQWFLTPAEKKRILLNNIYGVDIDPQAVEVTKLNLLLCALENENKSTLGQLALIHERALPDLSGNIKCGNSLIGPDFYEGKQMSLFDEDTLYRINAFDWSAEFPKIFKGKNPGFDAVIGNPPYVRIQAMRDTQPESVDYFSQKYESASKGNYDIYVVFVERGLSLLNRTGRLGYILPSKFLSTDYGESLREHLADSRVVEHLVDFGHEQVFGNATTYTCLLFLDRAKTTEFEYLRTSPNQLFSAPERRETVPTTQLDSHPWILVGDKAISLLGRIREQSTSLLELPAAMSRGTSTGADDVFCLKFVDGNLKTRKGDSVEVEESLLRVPLYATDFSRFIFHSRDQERIIFPYAVRKEGYDIMREVVLAAEFPKAYRYLLINKKRLESRKQYRQWYGYSAPRNLNVHESADFLVPLLADRGLCASMPKEKDRFCVMASAGFSVSVRNLDISPLYVLGLVNSKLLFWNLRLISNKFRAGWITCTKQYFGTLPIKSIDFQNTDEKRRHDEIVDIVESMLSLHVQLSAARAEHDKTLIQRQISATDKQIGRLVYELYDLTDEEIKIVESEGKE